VTGRPRPRWLAGSPASSTAPAAVDEVPEATRALVLARAGHRCESCGAHLIGKPYNLHHRQARGMGGTRAALAHSPVNLLALCGRGNHSGCHALVHTNVTEARGAGMLVRRAADPSRIPVTLHDGRTVLLTADGTYTPAEA
jgi:hypothetical protein